MTLYLGNNLISGVATPTEPTRNIGQVIPSTIPLTDAGLHLLDGSLIDGSGIYADFVSYIADLYDSGNYSAIFTTESTWQSTVASKGVCGKFVYNSGNSTVRIPKWGSQSYSKGLTISASSTVPVKGNGKTLGLTNGSSTAGLYGISADNNYHLFNPSAYNTNVGSTPADISSALGKTFGITTDGTKSGVVADTSSLLSITNYPLDCYYYIVLATVTKTEIEVDIDEIATDLNGKADVDLTNVANRCYPIDGQWVYKAATLASGVAAPTTDAITYSLSSYLPNDGYKYEVIFTTQVATGSSSGDTISVALQTDIIQGNVYVCRARTRASANVSAFGTCILPVGLNRSVTVDYYAANTGTFSLYARGYRRIGTNS